MYLYMTMNAIIISFLLFVSLSTIDVNYQSIEIRIDMVTYDDRMYVYGYYSWTGNGNVSYSKNYVITANNNALTCITLDKDFREKCYTFNLSSYVFLALDIFFI